ncbi:5-(carboxyamino)imidazole ribonucleotide mutase [Ileibacterium valens]|uniref:N5-carboxyaminoimidazole ribonucleotide mutase n=1 Tax=Ileibacterium valens TaxID=1862668 RepID=A0A1U7NJ69_9FIRM|nr:5-(carboxyamino)imidazole ribonucleotide mutase [Ileibacterium valens]OLU36420.1 5-(carboxyamino)imidazole ribonucleotide mutase [Erysipelotrichaceae bacterium NYU-BL-E8]OLU41422.1 5-(carboxyamino)imidazole ribonucleotide mutase [Erysipelotrichaceae bacterium NYU-BL-F16]OLU43083.1 5-(carboxyamino)imidazole ribonucleotide mutase [Ileibacterium valens]
MENSKVLIVMGSRSDLPAMEGCMKQLDEFKIGYTVRILSAHRTPEAVIELSENARKSGYEVIIAAAGGAAHLAGVLASSTILPVIGIPIQTSALGGMDSLLSTVQMPGGVPVATVAIGKAGPKNAAILAAQIMALQDPKLADTLTAFKKAQAKAVLDDSYLN